MSGSCFQRKHIAYSYIVRILQNFISPGDSVLEVGCGEQQYKDHLPSVNYFGLDLPESVYLDGDPAYLCSAESMPINDSVFDVVFGVATYYLHGNPDRSFAECFRVLKPGGQLLIFDYKKRFLEKRKAEHGGNAVWDYKGIASRLERAGFDATKIENISSLVDNADCPGSFRLALRRLRRITGTEASNWLIVRATKMCNQ